MKVAIMQPYFFPYLGYFQLISAVDTFVFYDDVHFIKKGFINRNSILLDGQAHLITIPCKGISQNKLIKDVALDFDAKKSSHFLKTISHAYSKAEYFEAIYPIIENCVKRPCETISELAILSINSVCDYLGLKVNFKVSSIEHHASRGEEKTQRLISISKKESANFYVNSYGGKHLYEAYTFMDEGLELQFLKPKLPIYKQFNDSFVGGLSIIDVLMFNSIDEIISMLNTFELE